MDVELPCLLLPPAGRGICSLTATNFPYSPQFVLQGAARTPNQRHPHLLHVSIMDHKLVPVFLAQRLS